MDKDSDVGVMMKKNRAKLKDEFGKPGFVSGYIDNFDQNLHELVGST